MSFDATFEHPTGRKLQKWQFGLRQLLVIIGICAVFLALMKWWGVAGFIVFVVLAIPTWLSRRGHPADLLILKSLVVYFVVSLVTLPFLSAIWLGEIPLLALVQLPKVQFANWLRVSVLMPMIRWLGMSSGSFSPDFRLASPYGLILAYSIPLGLLFVFFFWRGRLGPPRRRWLCVLFTLVVLDFCFTMLFARGPGLTIY